MKCSSSLTHEHRIMCPISVYLLRLTTSLKKVALLLRPTYVVPRGNTLGSMEYALSPTELDYALNSPVTHSPAVKETPPMAWRAVCTARATPAFKLLFAQALYFSGLYVLLLLNASLLVAICVVAAKTAQDARGALAEAHAIVPEIHSILALVRDLCAAPAFAPY